MSKRTIPLLVAVALSAAGCISKPNHQPAASLTPEQTADAARVLLLKTCPGDAPSSGAAGAMGPALAAILTGLAPVVADLGLNFVKDNMQQKKDNLTGDFVATGAGTLTIEKEPARCLVIARGKFGPGDWREESTGQFAPLTPAAMRQIGLVRYPDFYLQMRITSDAAKPGTIMLVPDLLAYRDTSAINAGSGKKSIAVVLALAEAPFVGQSGDPAKKAEAVGSAMAKAAFAFPNREIGKVYVAPPPSASQAEQLDLMNPFADQARVLSIKRTDNTVPSSPLNLIAYVTESESPSRVYEILLKTVTENETKIEKVLSDWITTRINAASSKDQ